MNSRNEQYLEAAINKSGTDGLPEPRTRNEKLLHRLVEEVSRGGVSSWNDLTDRPFYEENGEHLLTIEFVNGSYDMGDNIQSYKDVINQNKEIRAVVNGLEYDLFSAGSGFAYFNLYKTPNANGGDPDCVIMNYQGGTNATKLSLMDPEYFGLPSGTTDCIVDLYVPNTIHQLDHKFIKDMYYEETTPLIESKTVTCNTVLSSGSGYRGSTYVRFSNLRSTVTDNETFKVIYDDVVYIVDRKTLDDPIIIDSDNFTQYIGDPYLVDYPFAIEFNNDNEIIYTRTNGTHIFEVNTYSLKQLDQKYIPPQTVYVNITENEDGSYSADKTYAEVKELIDNGVNVKCVCETFIAPFVNAHNGRYAFAFENIMTDIIVQVIIYNGGCDVMGNRLSTVISDLIDSKLGVIENGSY